MSLSFLNSVSAKRIPRWIEGENPSPKMPVLSSSDTHDLYAAYTMDNFKRFERACVDMFVKFWVSRIPCDIKDQLLEVIRNSKTRRDMWVRFRTVIPPDHEVVIDGRVLSSRHIIHKTDALAQIAAAIGDHIHVRAVPDEGGLIFLRIEYWPPRGHQVAPPVHNPEDAYNDMPPLDMPDFPNS
jgi:hypothetical protein